MSDEREDLPGEPRVGSSPPPGPDDHDSSTPPPEPIEAPEPITAPEQADGLSTATPGMTSSTPSPGGEEPDRAAKGGRFLTRYAGLPEVGWGIGMIALGVLIAVGLMLTGTIMVAIFDPEFDSLIAKQASQLVVALSLACTAIAFALVDAGGRVKEALGKLGLGPRVALSALGLAIFALVAYLIAAILLSTWLDPDQEDVTDELGTGAVAAFLIVIAAPVSEELFFRGFMYAGLRRSMPIWPAALISATIWGSLHLSSGNIAVAVQLAVFGVALAWLYERSGTLWAPLFAHALNNTIAFIVLVS